MVCLEVEGRVVFGCIGFRGRSWVWEGVRRGLVLELAVKLGLGLWLGSEGWLGLELGFIFWLGLGVRVVAEI